MSRIAPGLAALLLVLPAMHCASQEAPPPVADAPPVAAPATVAVVMHTTLGDIHVTLEVERAPITAGNFLRYVDDKRFDGITFYRAMKVTEDGKYGLVQGGLSDPKRLFKPIAHEPPAITGLSHVDGAISMGRNEPGTAVADFFIVVGDLVSLDGTPDGTDLGYAAFGRVTQGMDLVRAILELPRSQEARNPAMQGQMLAEPVKILTVRREPQGAPQ